VPLVAGVYSRTTEPAVWLVVSSGPATASPDDSSADVAPGPSRLTRAVDTKYSSRVATAVSRTDAACPAVRPTAYTSMGSARVETTPVTVPGPTAVPGRSSASVARLSVRSFPATDR